MTNVNTKSGKNSAPDADNWRPHVPAWTEETAAAWEPARRRSTPATTEYRTPQSAGSPTNNTILQPTTTSPRIVRWCLFSCITAFLRRRYYIRRALATFTYNTVTKITQFPATRYQFEWHESVAQTEKSGFVRAFWWQVVLVATTHTQR